MKPIDDSAAAAPALRPGYPYIQVLAKSLLASLLAAGIIGVSAYLASGYAGWGLERSGDAVSQAQARTREAAFASLGTIELSAIPASEVRAAVSHMGLAVTEEAALLADLGAPPPLPSRSAAGLPGTEPAAGRPERARLAWITLWDTDAEDGDVVRIDSGGYSRTVTLAKRPLTIAVPVPANSILTVTGIRDGEGGGITVGLASGGARAVFPVMSVGQTLGLNVHMN